MARKSSIPEEIQQYKPCSCCRIRNDNGTYRVYKYMGLNVCERFYYLVFYVRSGIKKHGST